MMNFLHALAIAGFFLTVLAIVMQGISIAKRHSVTFESQATSFTTECALMLVAVSAFPGAVLLSCFYRSTV